MIVIFDLETTKLIPEDRNIQSLEISFAGTCIDGKVSFYSKDNINELFEILDLSELIVGHNLFAFDYIILQKYATFDVTLKYKHKTFDTFRIIEKKTDCRVSLNDLAKRNLNSEKSGKGIDAPKLFIEGKLDELKEYLAQDLRLTEQIFLHIKTHKSLKYGHTIYKDPIEKTLNISIEDR